jgi:hypothetical protein
VQCWGLNSLGQLGNGTTTDSLEPVAVVGITNALGVAAGSYHTCAVLSSGAVQCWGRNSYSNVDNLGGELGNGTSANSSIPVTVSGF